MREIIVGTRKSSLAIAQTNIMLKQLQNEYPSVRFRLKEISTTGDERTDISIGKFGRTGIFYENMEALLRKQVIDIAIHSLKDVPVHPPDDLPIIAIPKREDYRDALLSRHHLSVYDLPRGAIVGTSSIRRKGQLLAIRPDLQTKMIRGPIDKRIEQLKEGKYDAIILAVAGLKRLHLDIEHISEYLLEDKFMPSPGQGALAVQTRKGDTFVQQLLFSIHDDATFRTTEAERQLLAQFAQGEEAPIAAIAKQEDNTIILRAKICSLDGTNSIEAEASAQEPNEVAVDLANELKTKGADQFVKEILKEYKNES